VSKNDLNLQQPGKSKEHNPGKGTFLQKKAEKEKEIWLKEHW